MGMSQKYVGFTASLLLLRSFELGLRHGLRPELGSSNEYDRTCWTIIMEQLGKNVLDIVVLSLYRKLTSVSDKLHSLLAWERRLLSAANQPYRLETFNQKIHRC